jgi:hypothetical protein
MEQPVNHPAYFNSGASRHPYSGGLGLLRPSVLHAYDYVDMAAAYKQSIIVSIRTRTCYEYSVFRMTAQFPKARASICPRRTAPVPRSSPEPQGSIER